MKKEDVLGILFRVFSTACFAILIIAIWNPTNFIIKTSETLAVVAAYLYVIDNA